MLSPPPTRLRRAMPERCWTSKNQSGVFLPPSPWPPPWTLSLPPCLFLLPSFKSQLKCHFLQEAFLGWDASAECLPIPVPSPWDFLTWLFICLPTRPWAVWGQGQAFLSSPTPTMVVHSSPDACVTLSPLSYVIFQLSWGQKNYYWDAHFTEGKTEVLQRGSSCPVSHVSSHWQLEGWNRDVFLNAKSGSFLGLLVPLESRAEFDTNGFAEGLILLKLLHYLNKRKA